MGASQGDELRDRRVGVCLSSGFFGFYAHHGVMRALARIGVRPAAVSGSSAGALVGALWASGLPEEAIRHELLALRAADLFDPPRPGDLLRLPFGLIRGARIERRLSEILPVETFGECPTPLAVTAYDIDARSLVVLDQGPPAPAVRASLSLPGLLAPATVDGRLLWDGGLVEKAPIEPLLRRGDLDTVVLCYLQKPRRATPSRSLLAGLRRALDGQVVAAARSDVARARRLGLEVLVVAPRVPRCGPHKLGLGGEIVRCAERETVRILETGALGCEEVS